MMIQESLDLDGIDLFAPRIQHGEIGFEDRGNTDEEEIISHEEMTRWLAPPPVQDDVLID